MTSEIYRVRFSDCDPMGHLNNARYIDYMFNAMEDAVKQNLKIDLAKQMKKGLGWVVVGHDIKYFNPVTHHEKISIRTEVVDVKDDQLIFVIKMFDKKGKQLKSVLRSRLIHFNIESKKRTSHPSKIQKKFESLVPIQKRKLDSVNKLAAAV